MKKYIKSSIPIYGAARKDVDVESLKASVFYLFNEVSKRLKIRSGRLKPIRIKVQRHIGPVYYEAIVDYSFTGYESYITLQEVPTNIQIPEDYWCNKSYGYKDLTYLDVLAQNIINPSEFRENNEKVFEAFKQFVLDNNTIEGLTFDFFTNTNDINFSESSESQAMYYAIPNLQDLELPDDFYIMKSKEDRSYCHNVYYFLCNDKIPQFSRLIKDYSFYSANDCNAPIRFKTPLSNLYDIDSLIVSMDNDLSRSVSIVLNNIQCDINYYIKEGRIAIKVSEIEDLIKEKYPDIDRITIDVDNSVDTICLYNKHRSFSDFEIHIKNILNQSNEYILDKIDKLLSSKLALAKLDKNRTHSRHQHRPPKYENSVWDRYADKVIYEDNTEDEEE